jgi:hypothetical protein
MRRLDKGAQLRAAMEAAGLSVARLAAKTKDVDPEGKGLSTAAVGFIVAREGKSAREECSDRTAGLIAAALGREVGDLFEEPVSTLPESTSTRRTQVGGHGKTPDLPERLMDQAELAGFLRKSMSWIDKQIKDWADTHDSDELWPGLIYVGRSRRFDPYAVLAGMQRQRASA